MNFGEVYKNLPPLSSFSNLASTAGNIVDTGASAYDLGTRIYDRYRLYRAQQQKKLDNNSRFIVYDNRLLPFSRVESAPSQYEGEDIPSVINARRRRFQRRSRRNFRRRRDNYYARPRFRFK